MTVQYGERGTYCNPYGDKPKFFWLLFRWRGSIWDALKVQFTVWITLFFAISCLYHEGLDSAQREVFEKISMFCRAWENLTALTMVLGFYTGIVFTRWWSAYNHIIWPDEVAMVITACFQGSDEETIIVRQNLMRYMNLAAVFTYQKVSVSMQRRLPDLESVMESGLLTADELGTLQEMPTDRRMYIPCVWFGNLVGEQQRLGRINGQTFQVMIDCVVKYRGMLGGLVDLWYVSNTIYSPNLIRLRPHNPLKTAAATFESFTLTTHLGCTDESWSLQVH